MKIYHHYLTKLLIPLLVSSFFFISSCEEDPECIQPQQDLITALTSFNQDTSSVNCEAVKAAALAYIEKSCSDTIPGFEDFKPDTLASLDCATLECIEPAMSLAQYLTSMDDPNSSLDETSYCALFDSAMAVTQILITAACLIDSYLPEGYELPTQTQLDSIITAGCDWTEGFTMGHLVGEWYTVEICSHEDGQNCSGAVSCQSVEPGFPLQMNFIIDSDGTFSTIHPSCECPEDENGNYIESCDWTLLDEQRPADQVSCEALGGNWSYELQYAGIPEPSSTNPNQFSLTMNGSYCVCHDENDNYIEGCDQTLVDEVETEAACLTNGGRWEEEISVVEFSYWDTGNSTPDTLSWNINYYFISADLPMETWVCMTIKNIRQ